MLWTVIAVLLIGGGIIGVMLVHKADELSDSNNNLTGNNLSLREQLKQAKAAPSPSVEPLPVAGQPTTTPTPSPSVAPSPSATPASKR